MQKFFQSGSAFFVAAFLFLIAATFGKQLAVYLSVAVVFFILGLAVRKKNAQKSGDQNTEGQP